MRKHRLNHTDVRAYPCSECPLTFKRNDGLKRHFERAHEYPRIDRPSRCEECNLTCPTMGEKYKHQLEVHEYFACIFCGAAFKHHRYRQSHYRNHHKDQNLYDCEICGESLRTSTDLKTHRMIHQNYLPPIENNEVCFTTTYTTPAWKQDDVEKPFSCDKCDKTFKDKRGLTQHQTELHAERTHACPTCGNLNLEI